MHVFVLFKATSAVSPDLQLDIDEGMCGDAVVIKIVLKSPRYTVGDFYVLYRFVRRRQPQVLVHAITFEQLFWISFIFGTIVGLDLQIN